MNSSQSNIKKAKKFLDKNHCIAVPTETVYGLAGNAYSDISVKKIFKLKKRPINNPLIVHYCNIEKLKEDCQINDNFIKLYNKFSPGPITFILKLKKNSKISKFVTNKQKNLAIRFPKAPSANISNQLSSVEASDVQEEFGSKIKFVLDGGKCKIGVESTIINLINKPTILRFGGLEVSKIQKILHEKISVSTDSKKKITPGQFHLHYSPGIPLRMNVRTPRKGEAFVLINKRKKKSKDYFFLSRKKNLNEIAKNLYTLLRKIRNKGYKSIAVEKISDTGIGKTINDRLRRASKYKSKNSV